MDAKFIADQFELSYQYKKALDELGEHVCDQGCGEGWHTDKAQGHERLLVEHMAQQQQPSDTQRMSDREIWLMSQAYLAGVKRQQAKSQLGFTEWIAKNKNELVRLFNERHPHSNSNGAE